jgi:hypothetical protein
VFECCLTATSVDGKVVLTDIGRRLALDDAFTIDDYLTIVAKRFRFPFPAFEGYNATEERIYPFCAVLKLLFAKLANGRAPQVTLEEVGTLIIGNNCSGAEPVEYYATLRDTGRSFTSEAEERQVREMLRFLSQFSFLKWNNPTLELDIAGGATLPQSLLEVANPDIFTPSAIPEQELLTIATPSRHGYVEFEMPARDEEPSEFEFIEGKRERKTHIRVERSPLLRKAYFATYTVLVCHMCGMDTKVKYPWSINLLELHHLLPLSSSIAVGSRATLLTDVVPLCPTCHRAVHAYYRVWLTTNSRVDFSSKSEAVLVYQQAVSQVVI